MPTTYTMDKGQEYYSDYELYFLNFAWGVTNSTHLAFFTMFPITMDFVETFTVSAKHQLVQKDDFAAALWSTLLIKGDLLNYGGVVSFGSQRGINGHVALVAFTQLDDDGTEFMYMLGANFSFVQKV